MITRIPLLAPLSLVLLVTLFTGCQQLSSIDWKDKGSVGPAALDGSPLSARVVDRLAATPMTMNEQIKVVELQDNRIRLSGTASSGSAVSEAMRVTLQVEGVSDVLDTVSVR